MLAMIGEIIQIVGIIGALLGAFLVYRSLKANHDWNRRKYAMDMVRDWDARTAQHSLAIERHFPHIRDIDRHVGKINEMTKEVARQVYLSTPEDSELWNLRFNIIELLNVLEDYSIAYMNHVVDRAIIDTSLRHSMTRWGEILKNFTEVVEVSEGHQFWQPFLDIVDEWSKREASSRKPTA